MKTNGSSKKFVLWALHAVGILVTLVFLIVFTGPKVLYGPDFSTLSNNTASGEGTTYTLKFLYVFRDAFNDSFGPLLADIITILYPTVVAIIGVIRIIRPGRQASGEEQAAGASNRVDREAESTLESVHDSPPSGENGEDSTDTSGT